MNVRKTLFGASLLVVQPLILNVLAIPATAYVIAVLGPEHYGQWSIALALTLTSAVLTNLGTRAFFVRRVAQDPACASEAFAEHLGIRCALALLAGTAATISCALLGYPSTVLYCAGILTLSTLFSTINTSVSDLFQATERLPAMATINFAAGLSLQIASVIVMFLGLGPVALAWAYVLGPLISAAFALTVVRRSYFGVRVSLRLSRYGTLLKECRFMGLQQLTSGLALQAENLLVPKLVSITEYGYFAAGSMLARRMEVVPDALSTAFYPIMVKQYKLRSPEALKTVRRFIILSFLLCIPPAVVGYFLAEPIGRLLFSENPELCSDVARISVWMIPLLGLSYSLGYSLNASGREMREARIMIQMAVLGLLAAGVLIWQFGVFGACLSLIARQLIGIVLRIPSFAQTMSPGPQVPAAPAPPGKAAEIQQASVIG